MSIIEQIRNGGKEGLAKLYASHRREFVSWAQKQFNCSKTIAEDAWQQAIIIFYENVVSGKLLTLASSEKTYLFAIGKNKLRESNRESMRVQDIGDMDVVDDTEPEPLDPHLLKKAAVSLDLLGEPCRSLLVEFYYHRSTMEEIVAKLGYKNEETAKSQKYKCLVRLRKKFHEGNTKNVLQ